jgi:hypothetical protein
MYLTHQLQVYFHINFISAWFILGKLEGLPLEYVSMDIYDRICRYYGAVSQVSIKSILYQSHHRLRKSLP